MNRRSFLASAIGGTTALLLPKIATAATERVAASRLRWVTALDDVFYHIGVSKGVHYLDMPLDAFDSVRVHLNPYTALGATKDGASKRLLQIVEHYCRRSLLASGQIDPVPAADLLSLQRAFCRRFPLGNVGVLEYDGWLIGVRLRKCKDSCVLLHDENGPTFQPFSIPKPGFYAGSHYGIGVLDRHVVCCGRIIGRS